MPFAQTAQLNTFKQTRAQKVELAKSLLIKISKSEPNFNKARVRVAQQTGIFI